MPTKESEQAAYLRIKYADSPKEVARMLKESGIPIPDSYESSMFAPLKAPWREQVWYNQTGLNRGGTLIRWNHGKGNTDGYFVDSNGYILHVGYRSEDHDAGQVDPKKAMIRKDKTVTPTPRV